MIVTGTAGKVLSTTGLQGPDPAEFKENLHKIKARALTVSLENQLITVDDDQLLGMQLEDKFYPFSMNALKTLCGLLKVPAAYINKLISNDLTLKNFNENPLKMGNEITAVIWQDDEDEESKFIAGFLSSPFLSTLDLLELVEVTGFMPKNDLKLHHWIYLPEATVMNFLQQEVFEINENNLNYTYQLGVSLHYAEAADKNLTVSPFYHVRLRMPSGEWMEWDFETSRKLGNASRKLASFGGEAGQLLTNFDMGRLSPDFMNMRTLIEASNALAEIKYKLFKKIFSATKSVFTHYTMPDTGQYVLTEIIPEYRTFRDSIKEKVKDMEGYQIANLDVPVSLPMLFNRIYYSGLLLDNPHFMLKSRSGVYKMMYLAAEETNIMI